MQLQYYSFKYVDIINAYIQISRRLGVGGLAVGLEGCVVLCCILVYLYSIVLYLYLCSIVQYSIGLVWYTNSAV